MKVNRVRRNSQNSTCSSMPAAAEDLLRLQAAAYRRTTVCEVLRLLNEGACCLCAASHTHRKWRYDHARRRRCGHAQLGDRELLKVVAMMMITGSRWWWKELTSCDSAAAARRLAGDWMPNSPSFDDAELLQEWTFQRRLQLAARSSSCESWRANESVLAWRNRSRIPIDRVPIS